MLPWHKEGKDALEYCTLLFNTNMLATFDYDRLIFMLDLVFLRGLSVLLSPFTKGSMPSLDVESMVNFLHFFFGVGGWWGAGVGLGGGVGLGRKGA